MIKYVICKTNENDISYVKDITVEGSVSYTKNINDAKRYDVGSLQVNVELAKVKLSSPDATFSLEHVHAE